MNSSSAVLLNIQLGGFFVLRDKIRCTSGMLAFTHSVQLVPRVHTENTPWPPHVRFADDTGLIGGRMVTFKTLIDRAKACSMEVSVSNSKIIIKSVRTT